MKRRELISDMTRAGCFLKRSSGGHDIWNNPENGRSSPVPRHTEVKDSLCRLIKKQPGIEL